MGIEVRRMISKKLCVIICIILFVAPKQTKDDANYDAWFAACSGRRPRKMMQNIKAQKDDTNYDACYVGTH